MANVTKEIKIGKVIKMKFKVGQIVRIKNVIDRPGLYPRFVTPMYKFLGKTSKTTWINADGDVIELELSPEYRWNAEWLSSMRIAKLNRILINENEI